MSELVINKTKEETEICVLENNNITEYYMHRDDKQNNIGNIYIGTVKNIIDGMQAAFIDIGLDKNAFISIKDALPKVDLSKEDLIINKNMSEVLKIGQKVLVQIRKEQFKEKGARVSTHITIPGNYVVLMPGTDIITVSQKITDSKESNRLKNIIKNNIPQNFGCIVRTDAENVEEQTLITDLNLIINKWNEILKKYNSIDCIGAVYEDCDIIQKVSRDIINQNTNKIYTNNEEILNRINSLVQIKNVTVELINSNNIFEKFGLVSQINNIDNRKIWLNCGGYIAIDKTEALTAIDVNSGKYVGENSLEETALIVNLEAAKEIMKQIRLKDIGGIVIIDYIDLNMKENQLKVVETMEKEAQNDRSKIDIKGYTSLNLVELTRKKIYT